SPLQRASQALHAVGEPVRFRSEAPAHVALTRGAEGRPWRKAEPVLAQQALAEGEAVGHGLDAEEDVHRALGRSDVDARQLAQLGDQEVARAPQPLERARDHRLAAVQRWNSGALTEYRDSRRV